MHESANWIWIPCDDGASNLIIAVRRKFVLDDKPSKAVLDISADSRYVLFVNGKRIGEGPIRSWRHLQQYDSYEISSSLQVGENIIAVQVVRWGVHTGQSPDGPGGLIAALTLSAEDKPVLVTDSSWLGVVNSAYERVVPRMAGGLGFTECYDARKEMSGWTETAFDDSAWSEMSTIGPVGTEPWISMQKRNIPFLTETPIYPNRLFDACAVKAPEKCLAWEVGNALRETRNNKNGIQPFGLMVAELVADRPGNVTMVRMNTTFGLDHFGELRINGKDVVFQDDRAEFPVEQGSNLLVVRVTREGQSSPSWVFETDVELTMQSILDREGAICDFYATEFENDPVIDDYWKLARIEEIDENLKRLRPIRLNETYTDIFALSNMRKRLDGVEVYLDGPESICSGNNAFTTVYPPTQGDLEFIVDFGREIVGFVEFELDAPEGTVIDFNCFEAIVDGTWSWTDNLRNTIRYVAKDGWQRFNSVVRRGFRYAQVTIRNFDRPVRIREIRCLLNTYPVQRQGDFQSSDALLNRIWQISADTTQMCMEDTFVDCPAYEQGFWVGDCRNESLAAFAAFGDTMLAKRCLKLAAESLWRSPMPECLVPMGHSPFPIIPDWSMFWVLACDEFYTHTADRKFIAEIWPSIRQTCRFLIERRREDNGLFQYAAWNFLDWAPMDSSIGGINTHENALMVESLKRAARIAQVLGKDDAEYLTQQAKSLKSAINKHLWNEKKHAYIDSIHPDGEKSKVFSQQTQTIAFLCGCVPSKRMEWVSQWIEEAPKGWVEIGSPWMLWFSLEALAKRGKFDIMLNWIRKYWGMMLEYGATTCWETLPSWANGRWSPTRSWCHAWSAAPVYILPYYQLGVMPVEPGFSKVVIAPLPGDLKWAKGRVPTPKGIITVSWQIRGRKFDCTAVVPPGVDAEFKLPKGYKSGCIEIKTNSVTTAPDGV